MKSLRTVFCLLLGLASLGIVSVVAYEGHQHKDTDPFAIGQSEGLDINDGRNCSDKSRRKDLCTGYHYHR